MASYVLAALRLLSACALGVTPLLAFKALGYLEASLELSGTEILCVDY
jgi:hypothetical protein